MTSISEGPRSPQMAPTNSSKFFRHRLLFYLCLFCSCGGEPRALCLPDKGASVKQNPWLPLTFYFETMPHKVGQTGFELTL